MPYVSARYAPPDPTIPEEEGKKRVTCTDDKGQTWWLSEDSQVRDWLVYVANGGKIEAAPEPPPPPRQMVLKSTVMQRVIDADKMDQAYAALTSNPVYFARWFAPDRPEVYCDDADAISLVKTLGLDPAVILAP